MRLARFTRLLAAVIALLTGLAAPAGALAHGLEHDRLAHEAEHRSSDHHGAPEGATVAATETDHPHYDLTSTGCCKLVLRLPAVVPARQWFDGAAAVSSQRFVPTDQRSWIDPPPTGNTRSRAPPSC